MRLDLYLVQHGHFESRARAQAAIAEGLIRLNGVLAQRASQKVPDSSSIEITGDVHDYVSRGGLKLESALRTFEIDPADKVCLDLGASTGGFTEVLLRAGARKVFAVDVGTGQLHPRIADDPRVLNLEKTHAKDLSRALLPEPLEIIVCDVSFISLKKALPPALALAAPGARLAALVKPQFEVGRSRVGKGGIVKPGYTNTFGVVEDIAGWINALPGWRATSFIESPIMGGDGNKEFLLGAQFAA